MLRQTALDAIDFQGDRIIARDNTADVAAQCDNRALNTRVESFTLLKLLVRNLGTADIYKALQNQENEKSEKIPLHVTRKRHSR